MEVFVVLGGFRLKKQTQIKPIIYSGSDAEWIPAFAGYVFSLLLVLIVTI